MHCILRNISELIRKYETQILDLLTYSCIEINEENVKTIFQKIFVSIFKDLKYGKARSPIHLYVYSKAIKQILISEFLPPKEGPSIQNIDQIINIEEYTTMDISEEIFFESLHKLKPEERLILALLYRHKITVEEIATLFKTSSGTIISKLFESKTEITKYIIQKSGNAYKNTSSYATSEICFFTKNLCNKYQLNLLNKDELQKISEHLKSCKSCNNVYNWGNYIVTFIEKTKTPEKFENLNNLIFNKIRKKELKDHFIYHLHNSWIIRSSVFISFIILIITAVSYSGIINKIKGSNITARIARTLIPKKEPVKIAFNLTEEKNDKVKENENNQKQEIVTATEKQKQTTEETNKEKTENNTQKEEIKESTNNEKKIEDKKEEQMVYKWISHSDKWQEIDSKLTNLLTLLKAKKAGKLEFGEENNGGSYYHFTIPDEKLEEFIKHLHSFGDFSLIKQEDKRKIKDNRTRCVIWIGRK